MCDYAVKQGYNPYASHLFFPQFLSEHTSDRELGVGMGLQWAELADEAWFCYREWAVGDRHPDRYITLDEPFREDLKQSFGCRNAHVLWRARKKPIRYLIFTPEGQFLREENDTRSDQLPST